MAKKFIPEKFPLECGLINNPRSLFGYLRKNFWKFFGWSFIFYTLFFIIKQTGFRLFPAIELQMLTNLLSTQHTNFWKSALIVLGIILSANLFFNICAVIQEIIWQRLRPKSRAIISLDLINYLHCQSIGFINEKMLGKMSQQANNIAINSLDVINTLFAHMGTDLIAFLVSIALIVRMHWSIALILSCMALIRLIWFFVNFKNIITTHRTDAKAISQIHGSVTDTIGGSMNVRAFSGRKKELGILSHVLARYNKTYQTHMLANRIHWAPLAFIEEFVFISVMFLCVLYFHNETMNLGEVAFVIGAYMSINLSIRNFIEQLSDVLESGTETYQNYSELNGRITIKDKSDAPELKVKSGEIDFSDVNFKYDRKSPMVLRNFSIHIKGGEHVGIVGISGGGKTTIIKLLMRLYDINSGEITIDGQNISNFSLNSLRKNIAFIPQDTALFNRTIFENLRYARDNASLSEIHRAAKFAGAHDFIMKQSDEYNTIVGDRGVKLSGGQRQRIAIARAFLQKAPILLVDEATSALDSETEEIIQNSLTKISKGKTTLVIAHRLSTLSRMDRIIVLDKGRIIETGTHKQLLRKRGKYAQMWKDQTNGFVKG